MDLKRLQGCTDCTRSLAQALTPKHSDRHLGSKGVNARAPDGVEVGVVHASLLLASDLVVQSDLVVNFLKR